MTCFKMSYETKAEALKDIKMINARRIRFSVKCGRSAKDGRKLRAYYCERCGNYHLTSRGKRKYD